MPWLTWQQAGGRFGLSPDAVRMRARRLGWRTQPGNEGRTLVEIPDDAEVKPPERAPERVRAGSTEGSPEQAGSITRLTVLLVAADARADRADLRAAKAEQRVEQVEQRADAAAARAESADADRRAAEARADRAEQRSDVLRATIDELRAGQGLMVDMHARELSAAQRAAQEERERADAFAQDEAERKARGLLARLRAAWRGE